MSSTIYLDHNATSPLDPRVAATMTRVMGEALANPASQHEPGRLARRRLEAARDRIAESLGATTGGMRPARLVLTSGGTEANNLAIRGLALAKAANNRPPHQVVISSIEHPSVAAAAAELGRAGWQVDHLPVGINGRVDTEALPRLLSPATRLVSVMLGNNETGVLQPVAELAAICRRHGVAIHTDAAQAVGKIDVQFSELGVTALTLTAHKLHGPLGIGGLLLSHDAQVEPCFFGGFQQGGLRPGTESVVLAEGLRKAIDLWRSEGANRTKRMAELRDRLEQRISGEIPNAIVVGGASERLPHTSNLAFPGLDRQALVMALDQAGVAVSTGSACASGSPEPSAVLLAMGCSEAVIRSSIRLSLGANTTSAEMEEGTRRILLVCKQLQQPKAR